MPVTRRATSKLVQARQRSSDDDDPTKGGVALGGVQASPESEVSRRVRNPCILASLRVCACFPLLAVGYMCLSEV